MTFFEGFQKAMKPVFRKMHISSYLYLNMYMQFKRVHRFLKLVPYA